MNKEDLINKALPNHVAIIMDGNGRWAKQKGEDRVFGHINGVNAIRKVLEASLEIGIEYLTLYAFSTENWDRPKEEVDALMHLLVKSLLEEVEELNKNGVRLNVIGNIEQLPQYESLGEQGLPNWNPEEDQDEEALDDDPYDEEELEEDDDEDDDWDDE